MIACGPMERERDVCLCVCVCVRVHFLKRERGGRELWYHRVWLRLTVCMLASWTL